jgi:tripartite-type tricarboxylate transporter receptor subunit TctC
MDRRLPGVVVENRPGASGGIGLSRVVAAPPDGYTLVTVPGPVVSATPLPSVGAELAGVTELARGPMVLVGTTARPMPADVAALFKAIKATPSQYEYATSGNGTSQHLAGEMIKQLAGLQMVHIPYKGGSQAVMDVVSGQVPLAMLGITSVLPHIQSGKLKAYAVTTETRAASLPDTPTLAETVLPGFQASQWFVLAAPKNTPAARVDRLNQVIGDILKLPDVKAGFENVGVTPSHASPADITRFVMDEQRRWQDLAARSQLPLN